MTEAEEILAFFEALPRVKASSDGPYTFLDRHKDFKAVFTVTPQGQRVLAQLLYACEGYVPNEADAHSIMAGYVSRARFAKWLRGLIAFVPTN